MQKKCLLLFIFFCCHILVYAQYENVWVFGVNAGLDFNGGSPPKPIETSIYGPPFLRAAASVCDATGKLLFYTGGDHIWDRNHNKMPNGVHLTPFMPVRYQRIMVNGQYVNVVDSNYSYTRGNSGGALIVPFPDDTNKYYVFSLRNQHHPTTSRSDSFRGKLFYSVVDMRLNGGMGDVVQGEKGILIDSTLRFGGFMSAVTGEACNVWVVVKDHPDMGDSMDVFRAFEVNYLGVNQTPVISKPGLSYFLSVDTPLYNLRNGAPYFNSGQGRMCFSPDGKKLAIAGMTVSSDWSLKYIGRQFVYLYDFDPAIGEISNRLTIDTITSFRYDGILGNYFYNGGICFSPNGQMLYVNSEPANPDEDTIIGGIAQYDLSSNNITTIINSKIVIDSMNYVTFKPYGKMCVTDLKLGPDGKIYYVSGTKAIGAYPPNLAESLNCIHFPNLKGMASGPSVRDVFLNNDSLQSSLGIDFPSVVPVVKKDTAYSAVDTAICFSYVSRLGVLHTSPAAMYLWDDGSTDNMRPITSPGTYWVWTKDVCHYYMDTFHVVSSLSDPPEITVDVYRLGTTLSYTTYQWLLNGQIIPGATDSTYTVSENGDYQVIVGNEYGCTDTSEIYKITNVGVDEIVATDHIQVYPNPATDIVHIDAPVAVHVAVYSMEGRLIKQTKNTKQIIVRDFSKGLYLFKVYNLEGRLLKVDKIAR